MTRRILGLETSSPDCRVAVLTVTGRPRSLAEALRSGSVVERSGASEFARHSDVVYGLLEGALRGARIRLADLDGIAVSIGPGSFTGLRVGLTVAKVLARFGGIGLAAVPTLEAMAAEGMAGSTETVCVPSVDARRGEVYAAVYRRAGTRVRKTGGPWVAGPGRLAALAPAGARSVTGAPRAATVAALGLLRLQAGRGVDAARLVPLYLRRPQAVEQRLAGRRTSIRRDRRGSDRPGRPG
ncbi:MAG: tRNA (adenosine(37)-N6)-threonylcarbamoyltransferase complex dimerization subunit type 1 TsaB [Candidatus Coatesbacteria bacterium]